MWPGQAALQEGAQLRGLRLRSLEGRHVPDHDPALARSDLADRRRAVPHPGMERQGGLDLAQLDAEAAELHLMVDPPEELQVPVRAASAPDRRCGTGARPVAGERIGDESFRRQLRAAQIAADDAGSADVDLSGNADRNHLAAGSRRTSERPGNGPPIRLPEPVEIAVDRPGGGEDRGLGDAVDVEQRRPRARRLLPGIEPPHVQQLTTDDRQTEGRGGRLSSRGGRGDELVEGRGGLVEHRHPLRGEQPQEVGGERTTSRGDHQRASTREERAEDLPDREVEGERVEEHPDVLGLEAVPARAAARNPVTLAWLTHTPLGRPVEPEV